MINVVLFAVEDMSVRQEAFNVLYGLCEGSAVATVARFSELLEGEVTPSSEDIGGYRYVFMVIDPVAQSPETCTSPRRLEAVRKAGFAAREFAVDSVETVLATAKQVMRAV